MNQDQINSNIRTVLKVLGTALATHGATKAAALVNSEDAIGLVLVIVGYILSHWAHKSDNSGNNQAGTMGSKTSVYAWLLIGALAITGAGAMTGCKSTPQQIAYQAAGTTTVTVETAIRAYNVAAKAGKTTVAQNQQVKAAYEKYQAAMLVVCDAGEIYASMNGTNSPAASLALQTAVANANAEIADVVGLIQSFGVKF